MAVQHQNIAAKHLQQWNMGSRSELLPLSCQGFLSQPPSSHKAVFPCMLSSKEHFFLQLDWHIFRYSQSFSQAEQGGLVGLITELVAVGHASLEHFPAFHRRKGSFTGWSQNPSQYSVGSKNANDSACLAAITTIQS